MQFQIGAVLQHSNTPSLRVAGFEDEDDDEDENEAPHEWRQKVRASDIDVPTRRNNTDLVPLSGHILPNTQPRVKTLG